MIPKYIPRRRNEQRPESPHPKQKMDRVAFKGCKPVLMLPFDNEKEFLTRDFTDRESYKHFVVAGSPEKARGLAAQEFRMLLGRYKSTLWCVEDFEAVDKGHYIEVLVKDTVELLNIPDNAIWPEEVE